ncbi:tyrosine-type recombinase/integrase, partial [uncultured Alistipes sp.]|uniref:tyrosine-type recombinase/integrase n=1 Tax=uncultured Alistipes sp. TaxID=538949 RepID=UPI00261E55D1
STWQNAETKLISNGLRFIFTCPLFLAQPITFHLARHNFGTHITLSLGVPIETVSRMMGHRRLMTTQIYAHVTDRKVDEDTKQLRKLSASRKLELYEEPQNANNL